MKSKLLSLFLSAMVMAGCNNTITEQDLNDYVEYCNNDSMRVVQYLVSGNWEDASKAIYGAKFTPDTQWVHENKPTFTGFIEWLEKKRNNHTIK